MWIICEILLAPRCCEQSRLDYHAPTRNAVINLDFPRSSDNSSEIALEIADSDSPLEDSDLAADRPQWLQALKDSQEDSPKTRELSKTIQNYPKLIFFRITALKAHKFE